jgi:hypothetical protein
MIVCMVRKPGWTDWPSYAVVVPLTTRLGRLLATIPPRDLDNQVWIFETIGM